MGDLQDSMFDACKRGDIGAARQCLQRGLSVNARRGEYGHTPLIVACMKQEIETVRFLLDEAGADVNAVGKYDRTALYYATSGEMASLLLSMGATVDATSRVYETPLRIACYSLREDVIGVLLRAGAFVNIEDSTGRLPIDEAMRKTVPETLGVCVRILQDLVRHGARWEHDRETRGFRSSVRDPEVQLWQQRVWPALRFAVLLWIKEHQHGSPLTPIPEEEIEKGQEATRTFAREFKASKLIVCRRTICVVGPTTAGKTSLIKSLIQKQVCLEHIDDRTIGIDHFVLKFHEPRTTNSGVERTHEVKFSDFAGQNVYQVMHSLFFTSRTLFLICIDLNAYSITLLKCEMLTPDDAKLQHMMNEFVERTVLSWIRIIFARQPEAEFVFVYTKGDTIVSGPGVDKKEVRAHAKMMLERVMMIVEDMRQESKRQRGKKIMAVQESAITWASRWVMESFGLINVLDMSDHKETTNAQVSSPLTHLWDPRVETCDGSNAKIILTHSTTESYVQYVRNVVERLIMESGNSYKTPEKYMLVLQVLIRKKNAADELPLHSRIRATFVDVVVLVKELQQEVPGLEDETSTMNILRTLRDCVDILWYENMEDAKLRTTVMLDPQLPIEFLRQVINHKHATGVICHAILSGLPYWRELNGDQEAMLAMKVLLQTFRLAHPASGEMVFDSDLIVPAYWKTNQAALWVFGGEDLRLKPRGMEIETVVHRVHWEFRFTHFIPETLFDHLIIASYSPVHPLEVGPDWILYRDGELTACRVVISRHWKTHQRSLHLEAVLGNSTNTRLHSARLWVAFMRVCGALACVLKEHPGLPVTSLARTDTGREPSLRSLLNASIGRESSVQKQSLSAEDVGLMDVTWMPPEPTSSQCLELLVGS